MIGGGGERTLYVFTRIYGETYYLEICNIYINILSKANRTGACHIGGSLYHTLRSSAPEISSGGCGQWALDSSQTRDTMLGAGLESRNLAAALGRDFIIFPAAVHL